MEQKGQLRDTPLPRLGIPQAQGTSPRGVAATCISTPALQVPASFVLSPQLSALPWSLPVVMEGGNLGNQRNTVSEGSLASSSLARCLSFLFCELG